MSALLAFQEKLPIRKNDGFKSNHSEIWHVIPVSILADYLSQSGTTLCMGTGIGSDDMTTRDMAYIVSIAEEQSITRAAAKMYMA